MFSSRLILSQGFARNVRRRLSQSQQQDPAKSTVTQYLNKILDNPLPLGVGALVVGLVQWRRIKERNARLQLPEDSGTPQVLDDNGYLVTIYKTLPLRHLSRLWGIIHDLQLPVWSRNTVIGGYAKATGCNVSEAEFQDLTQYSNLGAFFKRKLKDGCRPIHNCSFVSPCDGTVLHCGAVDSKTGFIQQVKGVTYSLSKFLGSYFDGSAPHTLPGIPEHPTSEELEKKGNCLYEVVFYLAPGDYHRFHSPVDWNVHQRRHFPGELLSVNPAVVRKMNKVFELNERAVYLGEWEHGFFSMTAVAATMVGGIKVDFDQELSTNNWRWENKTFFQKMFEENGGVQIKKGDCFGEFNLGSTVVLVFEAPENFSWNLEAGEKVKVGIPLCQPAAAVEAECTIPHELSLIHHVIK
jgi:phosphatidylserine decarboxylase